MTVRRWLLAAAVAVGLTGTAFAQRPGGSGGCGGGSSQMRGSPGGTNQLRGGPGGMTNQLRGNSGGFNQLAGQLQGQQMMLQAQAQAQQNQLSAVQGWNAAQAGYQNYARLYAAQQKRLAQAQLQADR